MSSSKQRLVLEPPSWKRCALFGVALSAGAMVGVGACTTPTPDEIYAGSRSPSGTGGKSTGGGMGAAAQGNRAGALGSGAASGGTETVAGSPSQGDAGDASGGAPVVGPDPDPLGCGDRPITEGTFSRKALREAAADCAIGNTVTSRTRSRAARRGRTLRTTATRARRTRAWRATMQRWSVARAVSVRSARQQGRIERRKRSGPRPRHSRLRVRVAGRRPLPRRRAGDRARLRGIVGAGADLGARPVWPRVPAVLPGRRPRLQPEQRHRPRAGRRWTPTAWRAPSSTTRRRSRRTCSNRCTACAKRGARTAATFARR